MWGDKHRTSRSANPRPANGKAPDGSCSASQVSVDAELVTGLPPVAVITSIANGSWSLKDSFTILTDRRVRILSLPLDDWIWRRSLRFALPLDVYSPIARCSPAEGSTTQDKRPATTAHVQQGKNMFTWGVQSGDVGDHSAQSEERSG